MHSVIAAYTYDLAYSLSTHVPHLRVRHTELPAGLLQVSVCQGTLTVECMKYCWEEQSSGSAICIEAVSTASYNFGHQLTPS